jgi:hypothetical protein
MPKKRPSLREDESQRAYRLTQAAIGEGARPEPPGKREKNPEAVRRGRKGGKKGGKARANGMRPVEREDIARRAAEARWKREDDSTA